jgi:hypothetical protein
MFSASPTRAWLERNEFLFKDKHAANGRKETHTLMDFGLVILKQTVSYDMFYCHLSLDIVNHGGEIVACEHFPPIYGYWTRRDLLPPPSLIIRTLQYFSLPIPPQLTEKAKQEPPSEPSFQWCTYAMDLDYGRYAESYSKDEVIKDIRIIQKTLIKQGASPKCTRCYVCFSDQNHKLGVHLYFPYTKYYPEECYWLANLCRVELIEAKRPLHVQPGHLDKEKTHFTWNDIVDTSIYSKTLRLPFLKKKIGCKTCKEAKIKMKELAISTAGSKGTAPEHKKQKCPECQDKFYQDRRYFPLFMLDEDGQKKEEQWLSGLSNLIQTQQFRSAYQSRSITNYQSFLKNPERHPVRYDEIPATEDKLVYHVYAFLKLISIRILNHGQRTYFKNDELTPKPTPIRSWDRFFRSILNIYETVHTQLPRMGYLPFRDEIVEETTSEPDGFLILRFNPSSSPAGMDMSEAATYRNIADLKVGSKKIMDSNKRKYGSFMTSDQEQHDDCVPVPIETMLKNPELKPFLQVKRKSDVKTKTERHDLGQWMIMIQNELRNLKEYECYRNIQVTDVVSSKNSNGLIWFIKVQGFGQHRCHIANRNHKSNSIYFLIQGKTGYIEQRCYDQDCSSRKCIVGVVQDTDAKLVFCPQAVLQDHLNDEQKQKIIEWKQKKEEVKETKLDVIVESETKEEEKHIRLGKDGKPKRKRQKKVEFEWNQLAKSQTCDFIPKTNHELMTIINTASVSPTLSKSWKDFL